MTNNKPSLTKNAIVDLAQAEVEKQTGEAISRKKVSVVVNTLLEAISERIKQGEKVRIDGFGIFDTKVYKATVKPNPQKPGEKVHLPQRTYPRFRPSKAFREEVNVAHM